MRARTAGRQHPRSIRRPQAGAFLLEALIAILIVALGVLGSVGLLARSMQEVDDARWRGEAAYLANMLVGQMWVSDRLTVNLTTDFASTPGTGVPFTQWKDLVEQRLPNADLFEQEVVIEPGPIVPANPALQSNSRVTITIRWLPPGERTATAPAVCAADVPPTCGHRYDLHATIGANQ
jgi:type IV pilus assembly protein PilV